MVSLSILGQFHHPVMEYGYNLITKVCISVMGKCLLSRENVLPLKFQP